MAKDYNPKQEVLDYAGKLFRGKEEGPEILQSMVDGTQVGRERYEAARTLFEAFPNFFDAPKSERGA